MTAAADLTSQAIEAAGDAIATVDATGQITSCNEQAERRLGHHRDQAVGQTLARIVPVTHRPREIATFRAAMCSGYSSTPRRPRGSKRRRATVESLRS